MSPFFTEAFGNASSLHQHGLRVRSMRWRKAREQTAAVSSVRSHRKTIIFTSDDRVGPTSR